MAWCGYCGGGGTGCIVIYRHWDSNGCQDGISCAVSLVFGLFRNLLPAATSVLSSAAFCPSGDKADGLFFMTVHR